MAGNDPQGKFFDNSWVMHMFQSMDPIGEHFRRVTGRYRTFHLQEMFAFIIPIVHQVNGDAALFITPRDHRFMDMLPEHSLATVFRKQCGMDVHDTSWKSVHHFPWDQSQKSCKYHKADVQCLKFFQHPAFAQRTAIEKIARYAHVPGSLHHTGTGPIAPHQTYLYKGVVFEMADQLLGVGTRTRGQYGHPQPLFFQLHGAKLSTRNALISKRHRYFPTTCCA